MIPISPISPRWALWYPVRATTSHSDAPAHLHGLQAEPRLGVPSLEPMVTTLLHVLAERTIGTVDGFN